MPLGASADVKDQPALTQSSPHPDGEGKIHFAALLPSKAFTMPRIVTPIAATPIVGSCTQAQSAATEKATTDNANAIHCPLFARLSNASCSIL